MFTNVLTIVALAGVALAQTFSINTPPSIQQCQVVSLSWVGGTGPFTIAAIPAGQVSAPALANIAANVAGSPYAWNANLAQGTSITIRLTDSMGNIAYSSERTIQAGTSSACLTAGGASGSSSGVAASASSASGAASSGVASASNAVSSAVASVSSISSIRSSVAATTSSAASNTGTSSAPTTSRPASSTAAASSSVAAAFSKASFNVPFLALAAALGCAAFGGFALLA